MTTTPPPTEPSRLPLPNKYGILRPPSSFRVPIEPILDKGMDSELDNVSIKTAGMHAADHVRDALEWLAVCDPDQALALMKILCAAFGANNTATKYPEDAPRREAMVLAIRDALHEKLQDPTKFPLPQ